MEEWGLGRELLVRVIIAADEVTPTDSLVAAVTATHNYAWPQLSLLTALISEGTTVDCIAYTPILHFDWSDSAPSLVYGVKMHRCGYNCGTTSPWTGCSTHPEEGAPPTLKFTHNILHKFSNTKVQTSSIMAWSWPCSKPQKLSDEVENWLFLLQQ